MSTGALLAACSAAAACLALGELASATGRCGAGRLSPVEHCRRMLVAVIEPLRRSRLSGYRASRTERSRLAALAAFAGAAIGWRFGGVLAGVLAAAGFALAGSRWSGRRAKRYRQAVHESAAELARALAGALSGGHALRSSFAVAARELSGPPGRELTTVAAELSLGEPTEAALTRLRRRAGSRRIDLIVAALLLQLRTGGDLAGLLRSIASTIESSEHLEDELRAASTQARFTSAIVLALPLGAAVLGELAAPGLVGRVGSSPVGVALIAVALVLQVVGGLMVRKIAAVQP
jgi:tight adherence protein B